MKRVLSVLIMLAMIASLFPAVYAGDDGAKANISIKYDIGGVFLSNTVSKLDMLTKDITNGFFRSNSDSSTSGLTFRNNRGTAGNNGIDMSKNAYVTIDVYVPVAGTYTLSGQRARYTSGGTVGVYVNGSTEAAGSYDCSHATTSNTYGTMEDYAIGGISFNEGWNSIKFKAETADKGGTLRTFTLSMGDGSACVLYAAAKTILPIGGQMKLKVISSKTAAQVTEGLSFSAENEEIIEISEDGTITALTEGETAVTISGDNAVPVTVTVKVQGTANLTVKYEIGQAINDGSFGYSGGHSRLITEMTKKETKGFFEFVPQDGEDYSGENILRVRQYSNAADSYIQIKKGKKVTLSLYVPTEGVYNLSVRHHDVKGTGEVSLYVNGSAEAAGSYDCSHETNDKYYLAAYYDEALLESISFNKGWNTVTFDAVSGGSLGNMTLTGGNGDGRVIISANIASLELRHAAAQIIMSDKTLADITDAKTVWASSDPEIAAIDRDGEIKEKKMGKTTIS